MTDDRVPVPTGPVTARPFGEHASNARISKLAESFGAMKNIGPDAGSIVRVLPCCGPGGQHNGHESRCHDMGGRIMSTDDYPHEHDHPRRDPEFYRGAWEVLDQDQGAGVYIRRPGDLATALVDADALVLLAEPETWRLMREADSRRSLQVEVDRLTKFVGAPGARLVLEALRADLRRVEEIVRAAIVGLGST